MSDNWTEHFRNAETWRRLLFILIFAVIFGCTSFLALMVTIFQFFNVLFTGELNDNLRDFGRELGQFAHETLDYLTFNTQERPFPFSDWPTTGKAPRKRAAPKKKKSSRKRSGVRRRSVRRSGGTDRGNTDESRPREAPSTTETSPQRDEQPEPGEASPTQEGGQSSTPTGEAHQGESSSR